MSQWVVNLLYQDLWKDGKLPVGFWCSRTLHSEKAVCGVSQPSGESSSSLEILSRLKKKELDFLWLRWKLWVLLTIWDCVKCAALTMTDLAGEWFLQLMLPSHCWQLLWRRIDNSCDKGKKEKKTAFLALLSVWIFSVIKSPPSAKVLCLKSFLLSVAMWRFSLCLWK